MSRIEGCFLFTPRIHSSKDEGEKNYYHKAQQTDTSLRLVWEDLSLHRDYGLTDNWGSRIRLQIGLVTITHPHIMPILYAQLYEV